ncbi:putative quinol monooxygenase [Rhizobium herbae]|uniref:Quinol monooxygenase YgiN n=1 Tax=Rhizobium herbae TaxID=508661 RepID=A0ABS4EVI9_9HYPH|nr:antibiotic biosynthesis monooxygenase family protein [Rhizobium herbae]MBP1861937.1 quinol monooxygenase YgiN [Rhizobium herbae]
MKADAERMVRMAELEIDPARIEDYIALLREEIEASVAKEPGVLMLHAVTVKGTPEKVRILEVYASREDYEAHIRTPHFLKYKTLTADMVKSLNLIDVDPIVLCAK